MFSKNFRKYLYKYGIFFLIGIAILIVVDYVQLDVAKILGNIIDFLRGDETKTKETLFTFIKELILVVIVVSVGRILWRLFIFGTSRKMEYDLRNDMFIHATKLSQDYYSHEKVGGMMTYFINDLSSVRMAYGPGIMMLIDSIFLGGFAIARMYKMNTTLTIIAIIPITLMIIALGFINNSMRKQFKIRQDKFHDLSDFTQESFSGLSVIKSYVREAKEVLTFKTKSYDLYHLNLKFFKKSIWSQLATSIAINLVILSIMGYGSYLVITSIENPSLYNFSTGDLSTYYTYFLALTWPTMALSRFLTIFSQAQASAKRLNDFLDSNVSVKDGKDLVERKLVSPSIEARDLSFAYPLDNVTVLNKLNFKIESGEMIGILGKTGSGKTTLVDLLLRVYNINENSLFLDGIDIMKLPIKEVRRTIGYVPQDNFLFSDTITNNISFAYEDLNFDEVVKASKHSDIYENITEFKEGFNTVLGERGVTVSGGQKQRISIARALAKNPDILILDDSVSAVDTKTEEKIIRNLYELRKGKTTIFIAHRISTVKQMDKIILLDDGKIIAIGTHDDLLKTSSVYKDMVKRQELEREELYYEEKE